MSFNTICQFPFDIPLDYYYIGVVGYSSYSHIGNNNEYDSQTVPVGHPPDLVVQTVQASNGPFQPRDEIDVYSLIGNMGELTSNNYIVDYYLSVDTMITQDDYHIGYVTRGGLAGAEQHSYNTSCQIPPNVSVIQVTIRDMIIQ